jgi:TPP-dependent pyruvate/acetoin dehydrogenase alpha subunit
VDAERLTNRFRTMVQIRLFEEEVLRLTSAGLVPGFVHPYTGQEAIAAGVLGVRDPREWVVTYYRCHGHALACGCDPTRALCEILTRRGGLCGGKGGSMHLAERTKRFLGASSIVGSQLSIAAGVAMAEQRAGKDRAVIVFCGDGALGTGVAYETMTIAKKLALPLLVVCEDNGWQDHTRSDQVQAVPPAVLCDGVGIVNREVDGNDVVDVTNASVELLNACRAGGGPRMLIADTYLRHFHAQCGATVPGAYRPQEEVAAWLARDPLEIAAKRLTELGVETQLIYDEVAKRTDETVQSALAAPLVSAASTWTAVTAAAWPEPAR